MDVFRKSVRLLALATLIAVPVVGRAADAIPAGHSVDLPGVKLWYTDTGGAGVPVILLHANTGTTESWAPQTEAFAKAGYRVIAFDRRGWGKSEAVPDSGPQPGSVAGDLDALISNLKLDKVHLVGVAGGGFVALDYVAWHPERVRSVVAAATSGNMKDKVFKEFSERIEFPGFRQLPPVHREVGASYRGGNPEGTARWMEIEEHAQQKGAPSQPLHTPNNLAKLDAISVPVLSLAGDADMVSPPAMMRIWAARLKNHEFDMVPDAGHSVAWEQPEIFNQKVLAFLAKH